MRRRAHQSGDVVGIDREPDRFNQVAAPPDVTRPHLAAAALHVVAAERPSIDLIWHGRATIDIDGDTAREGRYRPLGAGTAFADAAGDPDRVEVRAGDI